MDFGVHGGILEPILQERLYVFLNINHNITVSYFFMLFENPPFSFIPSLSFVRDSR